MDRVLAPRSNRSPIPSWLARWHAVAISNAHKPIQAFLEESCVCTVSAMWMRSLCFLLPALASAEIQDFGILLPPTDLYIHYADGFLRGPSASIDLTDLTFTALENLFLDDILGEDDEGFDDDASGFNDDDGARKRRRLDGGLDVSSTYIDVVAFSLPSSCANSKNGCDWADLGVGAKTDTDAMRWCCSNDAVDLGLCDGGEQYGRLIVSDKFQGEQRSIAVPEEGIVAKKLRNPMLNLNDTGRYVVVFANCNSMGREIMVSGEAVWKSKHGYLPGELFGFMHLFTFLAAVYAALFAWYMILMMKNKTARIPIEKWILMTIVLGLFELCFRSADYHDWNTDGYRDNWLTYVGILFGVAKHGISRCLIVMVALGWGVIRDDLGSTMKKIVVLGVTYVAVTAARDFMIVLAVQDLTTLSYDEEAKLFDVATILTFVVAALDVIFIMWILDALNNTMQYLESMNQTRKLARYLRLRTLFLFSILFAAIMAVFALVNTYNEDGLAREEDEWAVDAATELNYLFVLMGVAWLWRPNPQAKEYAFVMELSAGDGDNDLELKGVVPSAMDDDDQSTTQYSIHDDFEEDEDDDRRRTGML